MKRRVFLIALIPSILALGLFWAIRSALAEEPISPDGTSCLAGTTVSGTTVTDQEKQSFGERSVAYNVVSAQNKKFKLIIGVSEVSHSGSGGVVAFTFGLKNLNNVNHGDETDGVMMLAKWAPGETIATISGGKWWGVSADHFLLFDHRGQIIPPQGYWYETRQFTISDYSSNIRAHMLNGGGDGLAHQQVCIDNSINLLAAFPPEIPLVVDQASSRSNLQVIRQTYNPVSSKPHATYERGENAHVVLSVFSPSLTLGDIWVSDFASGMKADSVKNVKYTLSDGSAGTFDFTVDYKTQTLRFDLKYVTKGENKIEYDFQVAN